MLCVGAKVKKRLFIYLSCVHVWSIQLEREKNCLHIRDESHGMYEGVKKTIPTLVGVLRYIM